MKLRSTDPFKNLVGGDWNKEHWFATRDERDRALKEMSGRYVYFRPGDQPSLEFEKIENSDQMLQLAMPKAEGVDALRYAACRPC